MPVLVCMSAKFSKKKGDSKAKSSVKIVEAIVKDSRGRVLLLKRSGNNSLYVGKWQLPGGKAEGKETANQAIRRELFEETGCMCSSLSVLKKVTFSELFRGKKSTVELTIFFCKTKGKVYLSKEHSDFKFVNSSRILKSILAPISQRAFFD